MVGVTGQWERYQRKYFITISGAKYWEEREVFSREMLVVIRKDEAVLGNDDRWQRKYDRN